MDWSLIPRDVWLFLGAILGGALLAKLTLKNFDEKNPVWPVAIYLQLISNIDFLGFSIKTGYDKKRKIFPYREQFVTSWFIWFFVLFILLVIFFGCGRKGC